MREVRQPLLEWIGMVELMKDREKMKKVQAEVREVFSSFEKIDETVIKEMKYLKTVVKEILRLHPPFTLIPGESREKCQVNGFEIPIKIKMLINLWAMGRDPKYWTQPNNFIPERFSEYDINYKGNDFRFIPFGSGRRICPGMSFAIATVELLLAMLLYYFDWNHPDGISSQEMNMDEEFGVSVRRKEDLWLVPTAYTA